MELRNESIFIDNLTKKEKENIEKAIKEVKPDIYIFDQSNSMTLNFDEDFLKHEIEFYRKYVDGKFGEITDNIVAFIEEKLEEFDNM